MENMQGKLKKVVFFLSFFFPQTDKNKDYMNFEDDLDRNGSPQTCLAEPETKVKSVHFSVNKCGRSGFPRETKNENITQAACSGLNYTIIWPVQ